MRLTPYCARWGAAAVMVASAVAGCGGGSSGSGGSSSNSGSPAKTSNAADAKDTGPLVIADAAVVNSLDPDGPSATFVGNLTVAENAYEGLTNYKPTANPDDMGGGQFIDTSDLDPGLASAWKSDDKGWTFELRKGVKSAAGNEFTSADVVWSYKRTVGLKATGAFVMSAIGLVTGVKAEGKYSVRYTTSGPSPVLPWTILQSYNRPLDSTEVKKHVTKSDPWASKWLTTHTAGYGAYTVSQYESGKSITLDPSPSYWGDKAKRQIKILAIPDASGRYSALQKGDINVAYGLSPQQIKQASSAGLHLFRFKGNSLVSLFPDVKLPQFKNPEVRQALQYATPSDQIVKSVYLGYGFTLKSIMPPYFKGYSEAGWDYTYDPAKAKQLVEQAGFKNGVSTELYYSSESPTLASLATVLQGAWQQAGINVKLNPQPSSTLVTRAFAKKDIPLYMTDTSSIVIPDGSTAGALWATGGFGNINNYSNPAFDKAYKASLSSLEFDVREAPIKDMQSAAATDPIFTAVAGLESIVATSPNVSDYQWEPSQATNYKTLATDSAG